MILIPLGDDRVRASGSLPPRRYLFYFVPFILRLSSPSSSLSSYLVPTLTLVLPSDPLPFPPPTPTPHATHTRGGSLGSALVGRTGSTRLIRADAGAGAATNQDELVARERGALLRAYSAAELKIFHCARVKMPLTRLDPSMLIGFVCDEAGWVDSRRMSEDLVRRGLGFLTHPWHPRLLQLHDERQRAQRRGRRRKRGTPSRLTRSSVDAGGAIEIEAWVDPVAPPPVLSRKKSSSEKTRSKTHAKKAVPVPSVRYLSPRRTPSPPLSGSRTRSGSET
ncbi:hypothetical protein B0H19DRAFT_1263127 [Mycena capillaripes]|nr:hypothetical protein B0H19DRAFT_1263127 [Mycena capillaripes]